MKRGTTPTHTFTLPFGTDMIQKLHVLYAQDEQVKIKKTEADATFEGNSVAVKLTQEETFSLECKKAVEIQIRVLTLGGEAMNSDIIRVPVDRCLDSEVLE